MGATKVRLNHGWFREFLNSDKAKAAVEPSAERVLAAAQAAAPVETGAYQAGLHLEEAHTDRVVMRVATGVPYGMVVEARDHVLVQALDAV